MARNINQPYGLRGAAKKVYLTVAKRMKLDSPDLRAFEEDKRSVRKRAKLKESAAKEAAEIQLKARKYTDAILEEMIEIATSETAVESAKIQAAHFVYDRAYGKAAQTNINANMNTDGKPSEITGSALAKRIEAALKRVEEITGGRGETAPSEKRPDDVRKHHIDPNGGTKH